MDTGLQSVSSVTGRGLLVGVSVSPGTPQSASPKENHIEDSISYKADRPIRSGYLFALVAYINPLFLSMLATWLGTFHSGAGHMLLLWWSGLDCQGSFLLPRILPFSLLHLYFLSDFPAYTSCLADQHLFKV